MAQALLRDIDGRCRSATAACGPLRRRSWMVTAADASGRVEGGLGRWEKSENALRSAGGEDVSSPELRPPRNDLLRRPRQRDHHVALRLGARGRKWSRPCRPRPARSAAIRPPRCASPRSPTGIARGRRRGRRSPPPPTRAGFHCRRAPASAPAPWSLVLRADGDEHRDVIAALGVPREQALDRAQCPLGCAPGRARRRRGRALRTNLPAPDLVERHRAERRVEQRRDRRGAGRGERRPGPSRRRNLLRALRSVSDWAACSRSRCLAPLSRRVATGLGLAQHPGRRARGRPPATAACRAAEASPDSRGGRRPAPALSVNFSARLRLR